MKYLYCDKIGPSRNIFIKFSPHELQVIATACYEMREANQFRYKKEKIQWGKFLRMTVDIHENNLVIFNEGVDKVEEMSQTSDSTDGLEPQDEAINSMPL